MIGADGLRFLRPLPPMAIAPAGPRLFLALRPATPPVSPPLLMLPPQLVANDAALPPSGPCEGDALALPAESAEETETVEDIDTCGL